MPDSIRAARRVAPPILALFSILAFLAVPSGAEPPVSSNEVDLAYYLPEGTDYDPAVPKPADVIGFEVGEYHVRHDLLVQYLRAVAEASDRVDLQVTGYTHEKRPLLMATITSPANHARLDEIRETHRRLSDGGASGDAPDPASMPVVVNLGYSVHGNEPSGANASLVVAYHLAAARDEQTREVLDNAVVLLDPSLNPDGLARFAHWANMHRGNVIVADPQHREHREAWPSGRTNHYWFDLNRDWLLAQHPESRARLARFHDWRPNVLTDFHEMGTNSTYFFQPGVPSRRNPLTPERNVELTQRFAEEHGRALDAIGSLYYTQETFDDFYYGKGSTYPDIHGAIGILFEQASSRGHAQEATKGPGGEMSFPFTVRNQVTTSFSTLRAALAHRVDLLEYQRDFFREALDAGRGDARGGFVFGDPADPARTHELLTVLRHHDLDVHRLERAVEVDGTRFEPESSFVVSLGQRQANLVRALFETTKEFGDSTFYDVSTWTLPLAFGVPYAALGETFSTGLLGDTIGDVRFPEGEVARSDENATLVAHAIEWHGYYAPRALGRLLDAGVVVHVSKDPVFAGTGSPGNAATRRFDRGTLVIPRGLQTITPERLDELLETIAREDGVDIHAITGGLTPDGPDLGSPELRALTRPSLAILVGGGVSSYEAGQAWHLLDHRFHLETTLLDADALGFADLDRYTHLVLVDGAERGLSDRRRDALRDFVRGGGTIVAIKDAARWASEHLLAGEDDEKAGDGAEKNGEGPAGPPERRAYADFEQDFARQLVSGAIFEVDLDLTHPLAFGYVRERLPVFRNSRLVLEAHDDPYATAAAYTDTPWLSGYVSEENLERLRGTPAVLADRVGRGTVVRMVDDPNFRAFWYGPSKLFLNAIFFSEILDRTGADEPRWEHE